MSDRTRDSSGQYSGKVTEQDILKAFDYETDPTEPMLKVSEIVTSLREHFGIDVSGETVRRHLRSMEESGDVASKEFGARAVGWTALVAPSVSPDIAAESDARRDSEEFVSLDEG
jgi:phenylalanyl-tRNA synthetase beta subunit